MKRILCLLLLLCMLLPTAIACKKDEEADETTGDANAVSTESETEDPLAKYEVYDDIGNRDFGGRDIIIATSDYESFIQEVVSEGFNGETVNDAIFARNAKVQERLNVNVKQVTISTGGLDTYHVGNYVLTQMQAGSHEYDLALASTYSNILRVVDNCWVDLAELDNINLSKAYWSKHYNEQLSIGESQYMASGYVSLSFYRKTYVTYMNETMLNSQSGAPDIFDVIAQGKWTIGYQKELAKGYYSDVNGNGKDSQDTFGFMSQSFDSTNPYWSSCELKMIGKNNENYYEYVLDVDRLSTAVDEILALFKSEGAWVTDRNTSFEEFVGMFAKGQTLMTTGMLESVEGANLRGMTDEYLILPMPRLYDNQTGYYSFVHDTFLSYAIPNTKIDEKHLDEVSAVLEVMASESYRTVAPAYYELALKTKYVSSPKTVELLDSIIANVYIDAGEIYQKRLNGVGVKIRDICELDIITGSGNTVSSTYNSEYAAQVKKSVKALNDETALLKYNNG